MINGMSYFTSAGFPVENLVLDDVVLRDKTQDNMYKVCVESLPFENLSWLTRKWSDSLL